MNNWTLCRIKDQDSRKKFNKNLISAFYTSNGKLLKYHITYFIILRFIQIDSKSIQSLSASFIGFKKKKTDRKRGRGRERERGGTG